MAAMRLKMERARAERHWKAVNIHRKITQAGGKQSMDLLAAQAELQEQKVEEQLTGEQLNEKFKKSGAFTLSYSTDASLYWAGLTKLLGDPPSAIECPVEKGMRAEHCEAIDSNVEFEVGNYGTITTSRIEWCFVASPEMGPEQVDLYEWPGTEREREHVRDAKGYDEFMAKRDEVNAGLTAVGEQRLSRVEFLSLRMYTGPLYMKYNGCLRSFCGVKFMEDQFKKLCQGNHYTTTINVLTGAIIKMGKIMPAVTVYRAPGGALPASFWKRTKEGCMGGIEIAFMSTTTAKEEALKYARRSPGMILFEISQGFVARGASISWLSQYPNEEEILLPPLSVLEVVGTHVEGAVLVVELRPAMMPPKSALKTGEDDLIQADKDRERLKVLAHEEAMAKEQAALNMVHAKAEIMSVKRKMKHELMLKQKQANWKEMMNNVKLTACKRSLANKQVKLSQANQEISRFRWEKAGDETTRRRALMELEDRKVEIVNAKVESERIEAELKKSKEAEMLALLKQQEVEKQLGMTNLKLVHAVGQQRFTKGVLRAKEIRLTKLEQDAANRKDRPREKVADDGGAAEEDEDEDDIEFDQEALLAENAKATAALVAKLDESIGKRESWPKTTTEKYVSIASFCVDRLLVVCKAQKATKRGKIEAQGHRKATIDANGYSTIALTIQKYEVEWGLQMKCIQLLHLLAVKEEVLDKKEAKKEERIKPGIGEPWQDAAEIVLDALMGSMHKYLAPSIETFRNITRHHKINTEKAERHGALANWFDPKSEIPPG